MQETKALISAMTGESRGGSRAAAPGCGFSRGANPWAVAGQAPLSMGLSRQEYWSALPFLSPRNLPNVGIKILLGR